MKIIFFGNTEYSIAILEEILKSRHEVVGVVSTPNKEVKVRRKTTTIIQPMTTYAKEHNIPLYQPENLKETDWTEGLEFDLFVVVAFKILPKELYSLPKKGCVNIHPSILPEYRGSTPIEHAIMNGDTKSGVTSFYITDGIDNGDIIECIETTLEPDIYIDQAYSKMMSVGKECINLTLKAIESGKQGKKQSQGQYRRAPKIKGKIWLNPNDTVDDAYNKVRALSPYYGGLNVHTTGDLDFSILRAECQEVIVFTKPGEILMYDQDKFCITVQDRKKVLVINELKPIGKRAMSSKEFVNGHRNITSLRVISREV